MPQDKIVTAFHKVDWGMVSDPIAETYASAAKYYIEADVVDLIQREDGFASIQAMMEAGICRLPFNPMVVEFSATNNFRWFILLEEQGHGENSNDIKCQCVYHHFPTGRTMYSSRDAILTMDTVGFNMEGVATKQDAHAAIAAVTMCLLLLNTKGIDKEIIYPEKLNKVRVKSGKPSIPSVTTLRIGTVYDREGRGIKLGSAGKVRVHWRAAYSRRQHHGPNNSLVKMVYIPPCLVNYNPELGEATPSLPEKRIKK